MTLLTVLEYPDSKLRLPSEPVTQFDEPLGRFVGDLFDTLYASRALGLSAPQVDLSREILVIDMSGNASAPEVYINPRIMARSTVRLAEEGCLSVPGLLVNVWRATRVRVRAQDCSGAFFERELEGLHAVCLQHEMDHFAGKLLVDHMSWFQRLRFGRAFRPPAGAVRA